MSEHPQIVEDLRVRHKSEDIFQVAEGGWFLPTWQASRGRFQAPERDVPADVPGTNSDIISTVPGSSGYYVLADGDIGALHTLKGVEIYTFAGGDPVDVLCIDPGGRADTTTLGPHDSDASGHVVIDGRVTHGLRPRSGAAGYSVVHLVGIPAYDPADADIPSRKELQARFPKHVKLIEKFTHAITPQAKRRAPKVSDPYMTASDSSVRVVPILTVGDNVGGIRFAGVPDGLGVYRDPDHDDWMRVLVTHELFFHQGAVRLHGAQGAFVSEWVMDVSQWDNGKGALQVLAGGDLIRKQWYWSRGQGSIGRFKTDKPLPFERLCSADLPPPSALLCEIDGESFGTTDRLFLGGEETHTKYRPDHGRALAHVVSGQSRGQTWELPHLGRCSYENVVLCPYRQRATVAVCLDDATNETGTGYRKRAPASELYVWIGEKQSSGHPAKRAGLLDGGLYGVKLRHRDGEDWRHVATEHRDFGFGEKTLAKLAQFRLELLSDQSRDDPWDEPGVAQQKESIRHGLTQFLRIEDGAWDPREGHMQDFYFVTTDKYDGNSRLFRLRFCDMEHPLRGGEIEILLEGHGEHDQRFQMLDSLTVDPWGRVLLQEDSGDKPERSRTLVYDIKSGELRVAAIASESFFGDKNHKKHITQDEESAGIIPVFELLGQGWYLTNLQAHTKGGFPKHIVEDPDSHYGRLLARELVEPGQLMALFIPQDISALPQT